MNLSWLPEALTVDVDFTVDVSVEFDDDLDIIGAAVEGYVNDQLAKHFDDSDSSSDRLGGS